MQTFAALLLSIEHIHWTVWSGHDDHTYDMDVHISRFPNDEIRIHIGMGRIMPLGAAERGPFGFDGEHYAQFSTSYRHVGSGIQSTRNGIMSGGQEGGMV